MHHIGSNVTLKFADETKCIKTNSFNECNEKRKGNIDYVKIMNASLNQFKEGLVLSIQFNLKFGSLFESVSSNCHC